MEMEILDQNSKDTGDTYPEELWYAPINPRVLPEKVPPLTHWLQARDLPRHLKDGVESLIGNRPLLREIDQIGVDPSEIAFVALLHLGRNVGDALKGITEFHDYISSLKFRRSLTTQLTALANLPSSLRAWMIFRTSFSEDLTPATSEVLKQLNEKLQGIDRRHIAAIIKDVQTLNTDYKRRNAAGTRKNEKIRTAIFALNFLIKKRRKKSIRRPGTIRIISAVLESFGHSQEETNIRRTLRVARF
jgi:hypothetical protein